VNAHQQEEVPKNKPGNDKRNQSYKSIIDSMQSFPFDRLQSNCQVISYNVYLLSMR